MNKKNIVILTGLIPLIVAAIVVITNNQQQQQEQTAAILEQIRCAALMTAYANQNIEQPDQQTIEGLQVSTLLTGIKAKAVVDDADSQYRLAAENFYAERRKNPDQFVLEQSREYEICAARARALIPQQIINALPKVERPTPERVKKLKDDSPFFTVGKKEPATKSKAAERVEQLKDDSPFFTGGEKEPATESEPESAR